MMSCHLTSCYVTSRRVMSSHVKFLTCHVMLCPSLDMTWQLNMWTHKTCTKTHGLQRRDLVLPQGIFHEKQEKDKGFFSVFLDKTNVSTNRSVSLIKHCLTKQRQIANARDISDHDDPNAAITHLQCMLWQTCKSSIQLHRHHTLTGLTQRPFEPVLEKPKRRDHQSTYHTSLCSP